jgi:predicted nucleic acid-binding protein
VGSLAVARGRPRWAAAGIRSGHARVVLSEDLSDGQELLHGVHRAAEEHRGRRAAFVEGVLAAFPTLSFDLLVARVHARMWADLAVSGTEVGAHDRLVAATAMSAGWRVGTANVRHFKRIPGLDMTPLQMA